MDDATLLGRLLATMSGALRLQESGARENRTIRLEGVTAALAPASPARSVLNSVVYEHPSALEAALPELAAAYEDAGILAWTVWVPPGDSRGAAVLERAGHRLDAAPRAMAAVLHELPELEIPEPRWNGDWDLEAAWRINDRAYGDPAGTWASSLAQLPPQAAYLYLARLDGEPASFVLMCDHGDDCEFWFAATVPEARGQGLVSGLLRRAMTDARARGCLTSTTQATAMGRPIYARLGYRDLGPLEMWERRRA